jgi:hypothetical protein
LKTSFLASWRRCRIHWNHGDVSSFPAPPVYAPLAVLAFFALLTVNSTGWSSRFIAMHTITALAIGRLLEEARRSASLNKLTKCLRHGSDSNDLIAVRIRSDSPKAWMSRSRGANLITTKKTTPDPIIREGAGFEVKTKKKAQGSRRSGVMFNWKCRIRIYGV